MTKLIKITWLVFFLSTTIRAFSQEDNMYGRSLCCCQENYFHHISVGPDIYYLQRHRESSEQSGCMLGVRGVYEKLKPWGYYLGAEGAYAEGTIEGSVEEIKLRSRFIEQEFVGRIGYTFAFCSISLQPVITPFVGYGNYWEFNKYLAPSPLEVHYTTTFPYFAFGLLSKISLNENVTLGFNCKARAPWNMKSKVTNDPDPFFNNTVMLINEHIQYRLELPIVIKEIFCKGRLSCSFTPFFEQRHYGGRESFPSDFFDTVITLAGIDMQLIFNF